MTLRGYRLGIRFFAFCGLVSLAIFIIGLDPESLKPWGLTFFFLSLWVAAAGLCSLFLLVLYARVIGPESAAHFIGNVLRQGGLLGGLVTGLAFLQYASLLAWWSALLLTALLLLLEFTARQIPSKK